MDKNHRIKISKKMSYYLRHGLDKLTPDSAGYVEINQLLSLDDFVGVKKEEILKEVEINEKKRFGLDSTGEKIRANQGHSLVSGALVDESKLLKKIIEPLGYCVHGTRKEHLNKIKATGLKRMNRTHIHFAIKPTAISGFRGTSNVLIHIDMKKAMEDGIEFYLSENDVILCQGPIDPKYFSKIQIL